MAKEQMAKRKPAKFSKNSLKVIPKLLKYLFKYYKGRMIIVFICVIICAIIMSSASIFLSTIIDKVITPVLFEGSKTFEQVKPTLFNILIIMICVYSTGVITSLIYTQIMARVSQGFLNHLRKDMFNKMEKLPIKFFDRNPHGDIMSRYTNDVDAVRQFISQTLIQVVSTAVTIITVVTLMLATY